MSADRVENRVASPSAVYSCPMHPEVAQQRPGSCPKCGMALEPLPGTAPAARTEYDYERLLLDAMLGDSTLFLRGDEVEAAWTLVTPILEGWQSDGAKAVAAYPAGSWGPHVADAFIERDGRQWVRF